MLSTLAEASRTDSSGSPAGSPSILYPQAQDHSEEPSSSGAQPREAMGIGVAVIATPQCIGAAGFLTSSAGLFTGWPGTSVLILTGIECPAACGSSTAV